MDEFDDKENSSINSGGEDEVPSKLPRFSQKSDLKEYLSKEKAELKELQQRLEEDKRKYKEDKREVDDLKYSDPNAFRQRSQLLDKVKESIEKKIDQVNARIAKVKDLEKKNKQ